MTGVSVPGWRQCAVKHRGGRTLAPITIRSEVTRGFPPLPSRPAARSAMAVWSLKRCMRPMRHWQKPVRDAPGSPHICAMGSWSQQADPGASHRDAFAKYAADRLGQPHRLLRECLRVLPTGHRLLLCHTALCSPDNYQQTGVRENRSGSMCLPRPSRLRFYKVAQQRHLDLVKEQCIEGRGDE